MPETAQSPLGFEATTDGKLPVDTDTLAEVFVNFVPMLTGRKLYRYQRRVVFQIFRSVLNNWGDTMTVQFPRQSGKSEAISAAACVLMVLLPVLASEFPEDDRFVLKDEDTGIVVGYKTGIKIGCFGPKQEQATIIFTRIKEAFDRPESKQLLTALGIVCTNSNGKIIKLSNGSYCRANTASKDASIEGDTYHLIVTDETQDISEKKIVKSIRPMGASTNATMIMIGTAGFGRVLFYREGKSNNRRFMEGGRKCHFQIHWKEAASENKFYKKYVESEADKFGIDSDEFRQNYCNEWILERGQFITESNLQKLVNLERERGSHFGTSVYIGNPQGENVRLVGGMDFGKKKDRTVFTVGIVDYDNPLLEEDVVDQGNWKIITEFHIDLIDWHSWEGDDYETQFNEIRSIIMSSPIPFARIALDANGCGAPICDRFKAAFPDIEFVEIMYTPREKNDIYRNFSRVCKSKQLDIPSGEVTRQDRDFGRFWQEMIDLEKDYSNGMMICHHPDEDGAHDDYPDSTCLMCYAGSERPELAEIEVFDNAFFN